MQEEFNWKQYWNTNAAGKRKKERVKQRRKEERKPKPKKKTIIVPTSPQWVVYSMYHQRNHWRKNVYLTDVEQIQKYLNEPIERYELKDKTIIRTVSAFHYLSQQLAVNGICRSFDTLTQIRAKHMKITGKESVFNVYDEIMNEFRRRYYVSRVMPMDFDKTDLDKDIKVSRIKIERTNFIFISMKDKFSDTWGKPKMFRLTQWVTREINSKIPIHLTQKEIIEKIKSGDISGIHKFGNPDEVLTNEQVLEIIG